MFLTINNQNNQKTSQGHYEELHWVLWKWFSIKQKKTICIWL